MKPTLPKLREMIKEIRGGGKTNHLIFDCNKNPGPAKKTAGKLRSGG
jgi:hypothetical protein